MGSRLLIDRYELTTTLGRGTMGTVWRAFDRTLGRDVAVKEIRQDPSLSAGQRRELRERMIREGRAAARVSHPSVATIYDAIEVDGSPWIIMELVEGRSLEQVIEDEGPLPPRLVAEVGFDLLAALRAAHLQGVLHRDVKPSNVLITETGRVVLTDFGIAKAEGDSALTKTGMVIGSPGYTAPERARGDHTGPESDLWSLGATLYFAVEGRPAYERASVAETLSALMTESADPPTQAGPLRPVLDGLLEKDHTVRLTPERAAAMLRTVADTPVGATPVATPPVKQLERERPRKRTDAEAPAGYEDAGSEPPAEEYRADQTMVVIRPKAGLRLPPGPGSARPPAPEPARPPQSPAPAAPPMPPVPSAHAAPPAPSAQPGPAWQGPGPAAGPTAGRVGGAADAGGRDDTTVAGRLPGLAPRVQGPPPPATQMPVAHLPQAPAAGPAGGPAGGPGGVPGGGLGTDLFAMHATPAPDRGGRIRVLLLMGLAVVAFLVLVVLAMTALSG
ncbi:serine/threonine-protein kinase [Microtetraspora glauca]|uniref:non-specific serine/threonine protein kinase n=1 Tax=Microtetraspora glauca TaxID=1996 RepID=A0ABV3GBJ6_MICGL